MCLDDEPAFGLSHTCAFFHWSLALIPIYKIRWYSLLLEVSSVLFGGWSFTSWWRVFLAHGVANSIEFNVLFRTTVRLVHILYDDESCCLPRIASRLKNEDMGRLWSYIHTDLIALHGCEIVVISEVQLASVLSWSESPRFHRTDVE